VAYLEETKVPNVAASLFTVFQDTSDLRLLFAAFASLSSLAMNGADQEEPCKKVSSLGDIKSAMHAPHKFPYTRIRRLLSTWKAKQLWKTLDQRTSRAEYTSAPCGVGGHLNEKRCLVVGAGPCGLRAAVELLLLGARVTVVSRETVFSRINQLSLMRWCGEDLKGLGAAANSFSPSPGSLYAATDRLQLLLLRTVLLLGAEIYMGVSFERLSWTEGSWWAELRSQCGKSVSGEICPTPPSPEAPSSIPGLAVVICAAGAGSTASAMLGCTLGHDPTWDSLSRWEPVLGLVCNVAKRRTGSEVRSFSLARPFATSVLSRAMEQTGVDLETVVHVNAPMAHFFLMMPSLRSLAAAGVILDETARPLVAPANINAARLDELARRVLAYRFNDDPNVLDTPDDPSFPGYADNGPQLFEMRRAEQRPEGLQFLHPPSRSSNSMSSGADWSAAEEKSKLLVAHVGDALMEPFWPEGLGLLRGFFGALDACSAIRQWATGATCAATQEAHQVAFQQLKAVHSSTKARILHDDEKRYALAPETRYRKL